MADSPAPIEYRVCAASDADAMVKLLAETFTRRDPPAVAGRGVAHQLVAECLKHGASRGYRLAITEATNKVSQHIFRKQGFVSRVQRSYLTHRFNGREVFASIADHSGPMLMDKSLTP